MSSSKHIIEINNRKYDALTGRPVDGKDGPPLSYREQNMLTDIVLNPPDRTEELRRMKVKRSTKYTDVPKAERKPQRSHTLMRPGVKKPSHSIERQAKPVETPSTPAVSLYNPARLHRAKSISKSPHIKKFSQVHKSAGIAVKSEELKVKQPAQPVQPAPARPPQRVPAQSSWPVADQFEKAMHEASSHLETFVDEAKRSKKGRKLAYATVSLVVVLAIGFGAYSALPAAKLKLAGNKAGFSPSVPTYSPAGFGMDGSVQANYGEITLSYKSRTDDKGFKITQEPSQWSSESLVKNFLTASNKNYQTVNSNGQTIYTYDKSDATWVDGGIWFKLEGNADLSQSQIIDIARGL